MDKVKSIIVVQVCWFAFSYIIASFAQPKLFGLIINMPKQFFWVYYFIWGCVVLFYLNFYNLKADSTGKGKVYFLLRLFFAGWMGGFLGFIVLHGYHFEIPQAFAIFIYMLIFLLMQAITWGLLLGAGFAFFIVAPAFFMTVTTRRSHILKQMLTFVSGTLGGLLYWFLLRAFSARLQDTSIEAFLVSGLFSVVVLFLLRND